MTLENRKQKKEIGGFTLIETLIVVAISIGVVIALGFLIYSFNATSVYQQTSAKSSASASGIMREVESLTFTADAVIQTHTFAGGTRTSSSTALVLEIPAIDSSGTVIANAYDYGAFYIVGTNVYRLLQATTSSARVSGTKKLSSTASSLIFTYDNADFTQVTTVTTDVQTQTIVKQNVIFDHQRELIRLRNH